MSEDVISILTDDPKRAEMTAVIRFTKIQDMARARGLEIDDDHIEMMLREQWPGLHAAIAAVTYDFIDRFVPSYSAGGLRSG